LIPELDGLGIDLHRDAVPVYGTVFGVSGADYLPVLCPGDAIIKLQFYQFQLCRPGMDNHQVIVVERGVIVEFGFDDGVDVTAFFDALIWVVGLTHERCPAEFEVSEVVGMIDHLGTIRINIEGPHLAAVPDLAAVAISDMGRMFRQ